MCGGTPPNAASRLAAQGLSPRVRGNLAPENGQDVPRRSIPACAGEPAKSGGAEERAAVYPRVCGGTDAMGKNERANAGLSPRVRGNLILRISGTIRQGSIPACAGEPRAGTASKARSKVYPRVCGGTLIDRGMSRDDCGLSPRVRGNRPGTASRLHMRRSIPACAGEPSVSSLYPVLKWVYPRVCGGTRPLRLRDDLLYGLSPRVRGNHSPPAPPYAVQRSIPACAGEPLSDLFLSISPGGYCLIVLHQVNTVGIDYLLGRLAE